MNREEITKLAREAGFVGMDGDHGALRRFAVLVAAAEREKVRSAMKRAFRRMASLIRADEREQCAKVCEAEWSNVAERMYGKECAAAIRARNQGCLPCNL